VSDPGSSTSGSGTESDHGSGKSGSHSSDDSGSVSAQISPAGSPARRVRLGGLRARARVSLRTLTRDGLSFSVLVPPNAGQVELRLLAKVRGRNRLVARRSVPKAITQGGLVQLRWRLDGRTLSRLTAGTYTLQVKIVAGPAAPDSVERSLAVA
jgi:hypothetical protein